MVKNRALRHISKWFLFPWPCWKEGIFLQCLLWESGQTPGSKSHNTVVPCSTSLPMTQSLGVFNALIHTEPLATRQAQVCYPRTTSQDPLYSCVSLILGAGVSSVTSLLLQIQNVVDFSLVVRTT